VNQSTSFQPVSGIIFSGIPSRRFPAFLAVWGGQTERETPLADFKLHAARFGVCVGLAALVWVLSGVGSKPLL
jgi:hypothetical protein